LPVVPDPAAPSHVRQIAEPGPARQGVEQLQAELAHMARIKTMGEMASSMAHELNQPLAVIVMQAEVAARKMQLGREKHEGELLEALEHIADQAYRAGEIIRRMKEFVRKVGPHRTTIDMAEIVEEVLGLLKNETRHAAVAVNVDVDPALPGVLADKIQVQQVLLNLIRNAMEAMDATDPDGRELQIRVSAGDDHIRVAVRDCGCGISPEDCERLFDTFYTTKPEGMGMGLAICRSIVEAHGGRIWAARNSGQGTTFNFTLPLTVEN